MFIQSLIKSKMKSEELSIRRTAQQIGVSHTTLMTFLDGGTVDLETVELICKWLGVSVRDALGFDTDSDTAAAVATILEMEPGLAQIFRDAATEVSQGKLPMEDFQEIVRYATFRIQTAKQRSQVVTE